MNEIIVLLKRKAHYHEQLEMFRKYHDPKSQGGLMRTLDTKTPNLHQRNTLEYELKQMRWRKDIDDASQPNKRFTTFHQNTLAKRSVVPEHTLYPEPIRNAIELRSRAANRREQAGRKLVENADTLTKAERADLINQQKLQHKIVSEQSKIINNWKEHKILPDEPVPVKDIDPEKLEEWKKEWVIVSQRIRRAKKSIKKYTDAADPEKVEFYQKKMAKERIRYSELAVLLGWKETV